eukprot:GHVS01064042.1.p1 GENE.GHVS01064042.1~~GHVS01064042.1.p1  ORF type:complete len:328 (+),score=75.13 GHVS01064042.1:221-1204(+)
MSKLTNADFRSFLLNAADLSVLQPATSRKRKKVDGVAGGKGDDEEKERRKSRYIELQKKSKAKAEPAPASTELYRDRACERRKGKDEFYQVVAEELKEMRDRSVEESKYLGGDVEHTHLVKGLDFALLTKVRSELTTLSDATVSKQQPEGAVGSNRCASSLGRKLYSNILAGYHPHHIQHSHRVSRIQQAILKGLKFKNNTEMFLPGRTSYTFDTSRGLSSADGTPTVVFRSRQDCSAPTELGAALKWHVENKKKPKHDRAGRRPGAGAAPEPVEEDEDLDMFGGDRKEDIEEERSKLKKAVLEERRRGNDMICEVDEQMEVEDNQR